MRELWRHPQANGRVQLTDVNSRCRVSALAVEMDAAADAGGVRVRMAALLMAG